MEELIGTLLVVGLICIIIVNTVAGKPTPYESYNSAIKECNYAKEYVSCLNAVNSTYVTLLEKKDEN